MERPARLVNGKRGAPEWGAARDPLRARLLGVGSVALLGGAPAGV